MAKKHLKTLTAPVTWPIKRKGQKFVIRPKPGKLFSISMPLAIYLKNVLKYCKTLKEVKTILNDKEIIVDGKRRKDPKYLLGLMDVLSIPIADEYYRVLLNKSKKLVLNKISKEESQFKISKIIGKTKLKKDNLQINLYDGKNLLVKEDKFSVGDSIKITLPDNKIKNTFKFEKGSYVFIIGGSKVGEHGTIVSINLDMVKVKTKTIEFETPKNTIFIVGKEKSEIKFE